MRSHISRALSSAALNMSAPVTGIQDYIDQHNLQKQVEELLNGTVKSKPEEPLSFMVGAFMALKLSYRTG